jgi:predicted DCC family thiol-disulfide oxidoreductase YuxK
LARIIYGKGLKYKLIFARLINIVDPFLYTRKQAAVQEVNRLEHILLRLLSFYENQPQPLLDNLYMKSFQYFLYKGILEGNVRYASNQSAEIQPGWLLAGINWLLIRRISKIFYWYIPQARKIGVPLPQGFNHSIFPF